MLDTDVVSNETLTVRVGTDINQPAFRRIDKDTLVPVIPTAATFTLAESKGGEVWLSASSAAAAGSPRVIIDGVDGWIYLSIPAATWNDAAWAGRFKGVWDLVVTVDSLTKRWWEGKLILDHSVVV